MTRRNLLFAIMMAGCSADAEPPLARSQAAVVWSSVTGQGVPREGHAAVRLASGKVLVAGGTLDNAGRSTATIFDPSSNGWTPTKDMTARHSLHCMVMLGDTPLAIGGIEAAGTVGSHAETFDPSSNAWTATGPLLSARRRAACVVLSSSKVLVAGGELADMTALSSAEIYDAATRTFSATAPMGAVRTAPRGVLLDDGRALIVGTGTAEIFDPATSTWHPTAGSNLPQAGDVVKLPSGKVLVVGYGSITSSLFDPKTETFVTAGALTKKRAGTTVTVLTNGHVLAAGGFVPPMAFESTADLFDPATNKWTATDHLGTARFTHTATLLLDGRVLIVGGVAPAPLPPPEIFNAPNGATCTSSDTCGSGHCIDGVCCDQPCDGACVACDVKGKEGTCSPISGAPHEHHATCRPFAACMEGACATTCASDTDCTTGNLCFPLTQTCAPEKGLCDGDHSVLDLKTGSKKDCGAFACTPAGDCLDHCAGSADCAAGRICSDGACVEPAPPEPPSKSCSYGRAQGSWAALGVVLALFLARRRSLLALGLLAGCSPTSSESLGHGEAPLTYAGAGGMAIPARVYHSAAALGDGRVLVVGSTGKGAKSAEVYDPDTNTWKTAPPAAIERTEATATTLADGKVLVVGGSETKAQGEVFDPASNTWTATSAPLQPRRAHSAILLSDGRVLVVGGLVSDMLATAEVYDPTTNAWTKTGSMKTARAYAAIARLAGDRVLVAGGLGISSTEIWDPASGARQAGPALASARDTFEGVTLPDGRVILGGGQDKSILVFDGAAFATMGSFTEVRLAARATLMPDGRVLFTGGIDESPTIAIPWASVTLVDPTAGKATALAPLTTARGYHTATLLKSGRVLLVGGVANYNEMDPVFAGAELINIFDGQKCGKNEECATGACVDGRCCTSSCTEACNACDVPGKEGTCTPVDGKPRDGHATCAPFGQCVAGGCVTVCTSDVDCDDTHVCDEATRRCVDPKATCNESTVTDVASGLSRDCSPYKCTSKGSCLQRCATSEDCVAASACDQGVCKALPPEAPGGCAFAGGTGGASSSLLVLVSLIAAYRRRSSSRPA
ncbi:MAG: kelch repeat-containing protein [Polyangiales bacterium]